MVSKKFIFFSIGTDYGLDNLIKKEKQHFGEGVLKLGVN